MLEKLTIKEFQDFLLELLFCGDFDAKEKEENT